MTKENLLIYLLQLIIYYLGISPAFIKDSIMYVQKCETTYTTTGNVFSFLAVIILLGSWLHSSFRISKWIVSKLK